MEMTRMILGCLSDICASEGLLVCVYYRMEFRTWVRAPALTWLPLALTPLTTCPSFTLPASLLLASSHSTSTHTTWTPTQRAGTWGSVRPRPLWEYCTCTATTLPGKKEICILCVYEEFGYKTR